MAIKNGKILFVGEENEANQFRGNETQLIDLKGKTIIPGFNDVHLHPTPLTNFNELDHVIKVDTVTSINSLIKLLIAKAKITPAGMLIRARGYNESKLGIEPNSKMLDEASSIHPIIITHASGHKSVVNSYLLKINNITKEVKATVLAKVETFNPGNSIKDRMALKMIEDAEKDGRLKPGGTIIEGTSGNTGMGLAIAAIMKGYKCIFTSTDKQSKEKFDALRALGAEVIVCPTDVDPEDPRSYYSVSSRLEKETPNSWKPNQYDNPSNAQAHYESTGPEIWDQTDGKITHLVVGVGTGGTISGTARFLKEKNPNIQVLGIDTYGSVFKKYKETGEFDKNEIYAYVTEGIGEDFLPENVDFNLIDHFEKVTDKDAAIYTRKIAKEEGIFAGNSAGSAMAGIMQMKDRFKEGDVVVVIFHDHGTRYLGKMFNDEWMKSKGWL